MAYLGLTFVHKTEQRDKGQLSGVIMKVSYEKGEK